MSIDTEIIQEAAVIERDCATLLERVADAVFASVVYGSTVTASPGQPVLSGELRSSWYQKELGDNAILIATNSPYALKVEHGHQRTTNHGPHSVKRTVGGFSKLVDLEVGKMRGS